MFVAAVLAAVAAQVVQAVFNPSQGLQFAYYSAAAYCEGSQVNSWSCKPCATVGGIQEATFLSNNSMDVYGYVGKRTDNIIVVAFRGTNPFDIKDWIDDIWYSPESISYPGCSNCDVHSGFYASYLELAPQMLAAIEKYGGRSAPAIFVTGHSLGGAMSTLATFELILAGYPVTNHIDFGRPRVGNPAFAGAFEQVVIKQNAQSVRLNQKATAQWSEVLKAAVRRAYDAVEPEKKFQSLTDIVKFAATDFTANHPASISPNRAARHAAMAHAVNHIKNKVFGELTFASSAANGTTSYRVTHNADPVPHLPLELMGFAHPPQEIFYNEAENGYTTCSSTNGEDPSCSDSVPLDIWIPDHLNYMNIEIALIC